MININDIDAIIPFFGTEPFRTRNVRFVQDWWSKIFPNVRIASDGKNKVDCMNNAISESDKEWIVIIDADCIVYGLDLDTWLDNMSRGPSYPFDNVVKMGEFQTRTVISNQIIESSILKSLEVDPSIYTGGVLGFSKKSWEAVGGYDKCFDRWGCEDDAFIDKLDRHTTHTNVGGVLLHMWHPNISIKFSENIVPRTYLNTIRLLTDSQFIDYVNSGCSVEVLEAYKQNFITEKKMPKSLTAVVPTLSGSITIDTTHYKISPNINTITELLTEMIDKHGIEKARYLVSELRKSNTVPLLGDDKLFYELKQDDDG